MKNYIGFTGTFLKLVWRNWYYEGVDQWHPFKYRISIRTAWNVANGIWFDKW